MNPLSNFLSIPGLELPVIQAPMAGVQDSALALAVCHAGGLGSLPAAMLAPDELVRQFGLLAAGTERPWNVNFFAHTPPLPDPAREAAWRELLAPYYREFAIDPAGIPAGPGRQPFDARAAELVEQFRPAVVSFHFGLPPDDLLARVKASGAFVMSSATTVAEARWLESRGVDAVIAQGLEAGGHRGMFLSDDLMPDKFEAQPVRFFEQVRAGYAQRMARDPGRFARIDAETSREAVWAQVLAAIPAGRLV